MSAQDLGHVQSQQLILAWCLAENHAPRTMTCENACLLPSIPLIPVASATGFAVNTGGSSLASWFLARTINRHRQGRGGMSMPTPGALVRRRHTACVSFAASRGKSGVVSVRISL